MTQRLGSPRDDALSQLLRGLTVDSTLFCVSDLRAPWAFRVEASEIAKFHVVLAGRAWVALDGQAGAELAPGTVVILPRGSAHTVGDAPETRPIALDHLLRTHPPDGRLRLRYGGAGDTTRLLCGGFRLNAPLPPATAQLVPDLLHADATADATSLLAAVAESLEADAGEPQRGVNAILGKLADVLVALALRSWLLGAEQSHLLDVNPLRDPQVAKAVEAVRTRPAEAWTLPGLAAHVGLSRTALATRFRASVGESPMRYVARLRLGQAAGYLSTGQLSIYEIAQLVGYRDDAALSKAFRRQFGEPPGVYRRTARRPARVMVG
jgi:AraC-like DNA-binding protein